MKIAAIHTNYYRDPYGNARIIPGIEYDLWTIEERLHEQLIHEAIRLGHQIDEFDAAQEFAGNEGLPAGAKAWRMEATLK